MGKTSREDNGIPIQEHCKKIIPEYLKDKEAIDCLIPASAYSKKKGIKKRPNSDQNASIWSCLSTKWKNSS